METIGEQKLWSFRPGKGKAATIATCTEVRKAPGHKVRSYIDLATKVAELQFMNREHVLLFRGQNADHKNKQRNTSLKPSLFRAVGDQNPGSSELIARFEKLRRAEFILEKEYSRLKLLGVERIKRQQILRWAILQHYEVCPTPLLDVTHSLRIAASFASVQANSRAYLFVIGVPNLSGAVTASAEASIQTIRLSSVCPPTAVRAHIQEGYLLGEYPGMTGFDQKQNYAHYEIDFGRRLVAKFEFDPKTFWRDSEFPKVDWSALYPNERDPFYEAAERIKFTLAGR
jgi:hypothetical protein